MKFGVAVVLLCGLLAACGSTPRRDLEFDRLHASLQALSTDPEFARLALAERALAEAAVRRLDASSVNAAEHAHLAYLAERRVDIAYIAAQTEQESARLAELEREHASLQLAASRRENAAMREELERQRQRELVQQEVAQRGLEQGHAASPAGAASAAAARPDAAIGVAGAASSGAAAARPAPADAMAGARPESLPAAAPAPGAAAPVPAAPAVSASAASGAVPPPVAVPPSAAPAAVAASGSAAARAASATPDPVLPARSAAGAPAAQTAFEPAAAASDRAFAAAPPDQAAAAAPPAPAPDPLQPGAAVMPAPEAGEIPLARRLAQLVPETGAEGEQLTLEDLVFEPGTAQLVAEAGVGIARVAAFVNSQPERAIRIEGHTDATGSPDANRALSLRRAEAVRDALIAAGVAAQRIEVSGEGSARPVASNDDADGRARNRRVVVVLRPAAG
ncbi:OmpA family protein [Tahibacter harae]|uniref:OmpA family protein n=1 Tax=Tahibacter harae TaxID=2963937 RepID=A0ABT1QXH2_9GAMM|nr:OmpA family protein [Tahibacter harae]MCQ4166986.1 OmpA family protein [Tahibacter harae]